MKMKKIKTYLSVILMLLVLVSCTDDIIDLQPRDQLTTDLALSTLDGLEGSVLGVYEQARLPYESDDHGLYKYALTDLVRPGTHISDQTPVIEYGTLANFDATNLSVKKIWDYYYSGLNRANIILKNIEGLDILESNIVDIARKNAITGEAYFFRAYFHYDLVVRYENIVKADVVFDDPGANVVLADESEIYDLIESDLLAAIPLLPEAADIRGADPYNTGKVTKATARHLLSKVYMKLAQLGEVPWSVPASYADEVIFDGAFSLEPDLTHIFPAQYENCPEIIFAWQFTYNDLSHVQRLSVQFTSLYDRTNGILRTFDQGGRPYSRFTATDYILNLYEPGDNRLTDWYKLAWYYDDEPNLPDGVLLGDTATVENVTSTNGQDMLNLMPTTMKHWEDDFKGRNIGDAEGHKNVIQYRLGEAYMIAAEAYWRDGNNTTALARINALRDRAGASNFTSLSEQDIIDEHARELAHEGLRYTFLKRLGILLERVQTYAPQVGDQMLPHHVRWPIPQNFVDLTKVPQNEGYD
jgi:hypothetical protein